jgi:putative tricarboxylic transport membrane protein
MKKKEVASSLGWILFGLMIAIGSTSLGLGSFRRPGPGMFHFIIGSAIILLSSYQIVLQFYKDSDNSKIWPHPDGLKRIIYTMLILVFYAIAIEHLGFILCTFIFFTLLLKTVGQKGWGYAMVTGLTVSMLTYIIFHMWLNVNLPKGLLGL